MAEEIVGSVNPGNLGVFLAPHAIPAGDRPYAMAVSALPGIGPVRLNLLCRLAGSFRSVWSGGPQGLQRLAVPGVRVDPVLEASWAELDPEQIVDRLAANGLKAVFAGDAEYPPMLLAIRGAPLVVYIRGEIRPDEDRSTIAVVGTRRMSPYGRWAACRLASGLAQQGFTIVSGLARGIDAAAHQAALDAGGRTVAVLPGGADLVYPPEHVPLAERVASRGALVSEYLPGTPVVPGNFPARNRLIAGMAVATVVVEAGTKSGALITAGFALQGGREVMAVPGRVGDPGSGGVHALIKDGAALVETASDVISALPAWSRPVRPVDAVMPVEGAPGNASLPDRLTGLLAGGPLTEQALIDASGNMPAEVRAALVMLEMEDRLHRLPGAIYIARASDDRSPAAEVRLCKDP